MEADKRWKLFQKNYYFEKLEKAAKTRTAISARRSHLKTCHGFCFHENQTNSHDRVARIILHEDLNPLKTKPKLSFALAQGFADFWGWAMEREDI